MTISAGSGPTGLGNIERVFQKIWEIRERFQAAESNVIGDRPAESAKSAAETTFRSELERAKERQSTDGKKEAVTLNGLPAKSAPDASPKITADRSTPQATGADRGTMEKRVMDTLRRELPKTDVPADLALALMQVESNFNSRAVSPKGAIGVMQIMPATAASMGVTDPGTLFDPEVNIPTGLQHLSKLMSKYKGDEKLALAAYNAGSGSVEKYGGVPPYPETRSYIQKIFDIRSRLGSVSMDEPGS